VYDEHWICPLISLRKLIALFCLAAVLCAALAPASHGLLWAILIPLLLLVEAVAVVTGDRQPEEGGAIIPAFFSVLSSRAPPAVSSLI